MNIFANTIPGLETVAAEALRAENLPGFKLLHTESGLVLFSADSAPKNLPWFNNTFQLFAEYEAKTIDDALYAHIGDKHWPEALKEILTPQEKTFRVYLSDEGKPSSAPKKQMGKWLTAIEGLKLRHAERGPDVEIWLLRRANGHAYLGKRLTRDRVTEKDLAQGELRPELTSLLCVLSEPKPDDIFLDPFAGTGALPRARARWPYNMIFASDQDAEAMKKLRASGKLKEKKGHPIIIRAADATKLEKIEDNFIDKVVTDPPWGLFNPIPAGELAELYARTLDELCRVVKPGGLIVWLTARKELVGELKLRHRKLLNLEFSTDVLVSGQKARILKWRRV